MKIQTFKEDSYRGCKIYYRNIHHHFEYLTIIKNELYTAHIEVRPHWLTNIFYVLDISTAVDKLPYSRQQLKNIIGTLRKMSEATIDFVLDKK
ncbi:MAG: hypothetical protein WC389_19095 [Lutibacter sp.]|jgi:hypothetical protein